MLVVIMDFKSFIIGLVVGIFGPYMDDVIRKIFSKFMLISSYLYEIYLNYHRISKNPHPMDEDFFK